MIPEEVNGSSSTMSENMTENELIIDVEESNQDMDYSNEDTGKNSDLDSPGMEDDSSQEIIFK